MNKRRYICYTSRDGSIPGRSLPRLYSVSPEDCWFIDRRDFDKLRGTALDDYYHLFPDESGVYELPKSKGLVGDFVTISQYYRRGRDE